MDRRIIKPSKGKENIIQSNVAKKKEIKLDSSSYKRMKISSDDERRNVKGKPPNLEKLKTTKMKFNLEQ